MRVLMFGRGVIASVYGWALERGGHEVEFFVRPGRADEYGGAIDLDLADLRRLPRQRRVRERWPVRLREEIADDYDVVVLSVSHHRLAAAARALAPHLGSATVLVLGNVWDDLAGAAAPIPPDRIVWGFPGAGGGFQADGVLRAALLPSVRIGTGADPERERAVRELLRSGGARVIADTDIAGWLAVHFIADAGIHAQGLQHGTLSRLAGDGAALREAMRTSRELLPVIEAHGVDLRRHRSSVGGLRFAGLSGTAFGWATRHLAPARMSLEAHTDPDAEEPRAICRDALAAARTAGIETPRLAAAEPYFAA